MGQIPCTAGIGQGIEPLGYMAYEFNGYGNVKVAWQQCMGTGAEPLNTVCHTTLVDRLASRMGGRLLQAVNSA